MTRTEPWYKNIWWSLRYGALGAITATWDTYVWWHRQRKGYGYGVSPWYVVLVWWLVGLPLFAWEQASGYWATSGAAWLRFIGIWSLRLNYLLSHQSGLMDWVNDHGRVHYQWLPPDGHKHGINPTEGFREYGGWQRSDLVSKDPLSRTRFYIHDTGQSASITNYTGWEGFTGTVTTSSASVKWLALLLLALPLAAQSPVGTWEADTTRAIAGAGVTETGVITFAPDGSYVAQRAWRWRVDDVPGGEFAFAQGTWRVAADTLCVRREDAQAETCQPFTMTAHTLQWGGFQFTGSE